MQQPRKSVGQPFWKSNKRIKLVNWGYKKIPGAKEKLKNYLFDSREIVNFNFKNPQAINQVDLIAG